MNRMQAKPPSGGAEAPLARSFRMRAGGLVLIVAAVQYLLAETVAAAAWKTPAYSYSRNYISDLGVPSRGGLLEGRLIDSPLHTIMNVGFIAYGILLIVAALLLSRLLRHRLRWAFKVLVILHGIGLILVGIVHGSPEASADGTVVWHGLGAFLAIVGGNLTAIMLGRHLWRGRLRRLGTAGIMVGTLGLLSLVSLTSGAIDVADGILERGSVYSIMAADLIAGVSLLWYSRAHALRPTAPVVTG